MVGEVAVVMHAWAVLAALTLGPGLTAAAIVGGGVEAVHGVNSDVVVVRLFAMVTVPAAVVIIIATRAGAECGVVILGVDAGSGWLTDGEGAEAGGVEKDKR